jgi:glycosyltransferase involved in cell wall biosynthesis
MRPERFEVIVVDSSPDEANATAIAKLQQDSGTVKLSLYRKQPEGPGPSRTMGAHRARGRFIAFLDSDCQATPEWLEAGIGMFNDETGIVQGRTLPDPEQPLGVFCRYVQIENENPRYEAANIFYRRECLENIGEPKKDMTPNDERPTGGEDTLMAWRVKRNGWLSTFAYDAVVYHEVVRISVWRWLYEKRMFMLPWLVREIPEMKSEFYLGYFLDHAHAGLALLLISLVLTPLSPLWLIGCIPYFVIRASEPTRTLQGINRIARALVYLPRDLLAFALLLLGSLRYRTLLL